jgi:hypothetical protein
MSNEPLNASGDTVRVERSADFGERNKVEGVPQNIHENHVTPSPDTSAGEPRETGEKNSSGQPPESIEKPDIQELETLIFMDRKKG